MLNPQTRRILPTFAPSLSLLLLLVAVLAQPAVAVQSMTFANGITAVIHTPQEIAANISSSAKGLPVLTDPALGTLELRDNAAGQVPFDTQQVLTALEAMQLSGARVTVAVFILPSTPVATGGSFARRGALVLAPGTAAVDPVTQATITTHEMGHVLTWAYLDGQPARWDAYMRLRNLDPETNGPEAIHAERAREILAEDIRFLFGGPLATAGGSIENHDLATPDHIEGLKSMLAGFFSAPGPGPAAVQSSAFPNPCNPLTTVEMVLPAGFAEAASQATLTIYDVRGAVVRTVTGGYQANSRVSLQWDGSSDSGSVAASGRYLYVMRLGSVMARGAVTLVR